MKFFTTCKGFPEPFGISYHDGGINFALFSKNATEVTLCLFDSNTEDLAAELVLDPRENKTGDVWHIYLKDIKENFYYSYLVNGPYQHNSKNPFSQKFHLLDPYAIRLTTGNQWGKTLSPSGHPLTNYRPQGEIHLDSAPFDWESDQSPEIPMQDLVIYEMHVRGFTQDPSSAVQNPGTFLGVIEKIPHLIELGVNAVELLPIQEFNECEFSLTHPRMKTPLYNFWGYSTVNFFAPMNRYASNNGDAIKECKMMIKALHSHGIEVILDIVFNHTAEGNEKGPVLSFKGIDNAVYYILDEKGHYLNYSGCGNTFNCNHPVVNELIIKALRYWVLEMHVDGFRFDLASIFYRGTNGNPLSLAPVVEAISKDPILANIKLIAEPWDAVGFYQVGSFDPNEKRWSEWNGKYRDVVRRFINGTPASSGEFAMRISGSEDLYHFRSPCASINFVTVHDGFTLADLVSYNQKHNLDNDEDNRDGTDMNDSWNCGVEGPTDNKKILLLRERQMRNFHLALMVSQGIPMLLMGDEYAHSKKGNNNTWCQDNELNWFQWDQLRENQSFYRFYRRLIHFRQHHNLLRRETFLSPEDVDWHGQEPLKPDWSSRNSFVAFSLKDSINENDLYIAFNTQDNSVAIKLPQPPQSKSWYWVVNTGNLPPNDFYEASEMSSLVGNTYKMIGHSAIMLKAL